MSYPRSQISAYKNVAAHSVVLEAQPQELVTLLLDGALGRLAQARVQITSGQKSLKAGNLHRVVKIIDELSMSLNEERGGEIARNLSGLYDYMSGRVLHANIHDDVQAIDEVSRLLTEIRTGWAAAQASQQPQVTR